MGRREMKNAENHDRASRQAQACREQRQVPVHRLEHEIEQHRHSDIEGIRDQVGCIAVSNIAATNELGEYCHHKVAEINDAGNPGPGT